MARRRRRGQGRRRRQNTTRFRGMRQRFNAVIKGTIKYAETLSIDLSDFSDFPKSSQLLPQQLRLSLCVMNGPSYAIISQWDGSNDNSVFNVRNELINTRQTYRQTFRWPRNPLMISKNSSTQTLVQVIHAAGGDVYGDEKPLMFYMADLWVLEASDGLSPNVDPPHQNIKHSSPRSLLSPSTSTYSMLEQE